MTSQSSADLVKAMTDAMTSDDVDGMVKLFAPDGEWIIEATGETFRGLDQIRQLATRSIAVASSRHDLQIAHHTDL
jgi:uncharacterized protein (TIGR02246 family)